MMVYGIIKLQLDDFSGLDVRWVPDTETLRLFKSRADRDREMDALDESAECYEEYLALDLPVITHAEYVELMQAAAAGAKGSAKSK